MTTEQKQNNKNTVNKTVDITISLARVKKFLNILGINRVSGDKIEKNMEELTKLKKMGGPIKPDAPMSISSHATADQKAKHAEQREKYRVEFKKYNDYVSENYKRLEVIYKLCKLLEKLHTLMLKDKLNNNQLIELQDIKVMLNDMPKPKKAIETEEEYQTRVKEFKPFNFKQYLSNTDLTKPNQILELINNLRKSNPDLQYFFNKDQVSKEKVRFNESTMIAITQFIESGIEELLEHGMKNTLDNDKKKVQPVHCVINDVEKCHWYFLFKDLPHFKAVVNRYNREKLYEETKEAHKIDSINQAKSQAKKENKPYTKTKFEYKSFKDFEVEAGYAIKTMVKVKKENEEITKYKYKWYGIDIDLEEPTTNFNHYIRQIGKNITDIQSIANIKYNEIKISENVCKFCSDLIIDFLVKICPKIRLLINAIGVKTVDFRVIETLIRLMMVDNYDPSNNFKFTEQDEKLITKINEKVKLAKTRQTVHKEENVEQKVEPEPAKPEPVKNETNGKKSTKK